MGYGTMGRYQVHTMLELELQAFLNLSRRANLRVSQVLPCPERFPIFGQAWVNMGGGWPEEGGGGGERPVGGVETGSFQGCFD